MICEVGKKNFNPKFVILGLEASPLSLIISFQFLIYVKLTVESRLKDAEHLSDKGPVLAQVLDIVCFSNVWVC